MIIMRSKSILELVLSAGASVISAFRDRGIFVFLFCPLFNRS